MEHRRIRSLSLLAAVVTGAGFLLHGCLGDSAERAHIKARYDEMQAAIRTGNTNAARLLFSPRHRRDADDNFTRYHIFAKPLGWRSKIAVNGENASICPERIFPIGLVGHVIEMIQVDGEWYFTGRIGVF